MGIACSRGEIKQRLGGAVIALHAALDVFNGSCTPPATDMLCACAALHAADKEMVAAKADGKK